MAEFTYDFFLFKFGLQEFAEMHLAGLHRAIEDGQKDPRIQLFGALCGQGLTLVHFSAQLEPRLSQENIQHTPNTP